MGAMLSSRSADERADNSAPLVRYRQVTRLPDNCHEGGVGGGGDIIDGGGEDEEGRPTTTPSSSAKVFVVLDGDDEIRGDGRGDRDGVVGDAVPVEAEKVCGEYDEEAARVFGGSDFGPSSSSSSGRGLSLVVLLLCPASRQFEVVVVAFGPSSGPGPTCGDVLARSLERATFPVLKEMEYTGLCWLFSSGLIGEREETEAGGAGRDAAIASKTSTGEMINALRIEEVYGVRTGDVLVAIPNGMSAAKAEGVARSLSENRPVRRLIRRSLRAGVRAVRDHRKRGQKGGWQKSRSVGNEKKGADGNVSVVDLLVFLILACYFLKRLVAMREGALELALEISGRGGSTLPFWRRIGAGTLKSII